MEQLLENAFSDKSDNCSCLFQKLSSRIKGKEQNDEEYQSFEAMIRVLLLFFMGFVLQSLDVILHAVLSASSSSRHHLHSPPTLFLTFLGLFFSLL